VEELQKKRGGSIIAMKEGATSRFLPIKKAHLQKEGKKGRDQWSARAIAICGGGKERGGKGTNHVAEHHFGPKKKKKKTNPPKKKKKKKKKKKAPPPPPPPLKKKKSLLKIQPGTKKAKRGGPNSVHVPFEF